MRSAFLAILLLATPVTANQCDVTVVPEKELVIVNPLVVDDARTSAGGPWHMASLLRRMLPPGASDQEFSEFLLRWLVGTKQVKELNGFPLPFPGMGLGERTVCRWIGPGCNAASVNPAKIPYRLLAITNRLDLHGHGADKAEGRFVFGALDGNGHAQPETVIFEYELPLASTKLEAWAQRWHALGELPCTTAENCEPYRQALEKITAEFSAGHQLGQIRTSHLAPGSGTLWAFREFRLKDGDLVSVPVAQTPDARFDNSDLLSRLVHDNAEAVLKESFVFPREMLAAQTILDDENPRQWDLKVDETLRAAFSAQTCNGCHGEKRQLDGFFHISPFEQGEDRVSAYLREEQIPKRETFLKQLLCKVGGNQ